MAGHRGAAAGGPDMEDIGCGGVSCMGPAAGAGCIEPDGRPMQTVDWRFVGEGRGGYDKLQNYSYVGQGRGSYEQEHRVTHYGWRVRPICLGFMVVVVIALVAMFLVHPMEVKSTTAAPRTDEPLAPSVPPAQPPTAPIQYPTAAPVLIVPSARPTALQVTPTAPAAAQATPLTPLTGLQAHPTSKPPFDCDVGFEAWSTVWTDAKKAWCCQHARRGCPGQTQLPYDCSLGLRTWKMGWSEPKKQWCCESANVGCLEERSSQYDCAAGFGNWAVGWSVAKKVWCCRREGKGCPAEPSPASR